MTALPPICTRFAFRYGGGTLRVYQLVSSVTEREARAAGQHGCDRHTLRLVEEEGFPAHCTAGLGFEIHVEDAWFVERTDAKRLPAVEIIDVEGRI